MHLLGVEVVSQYKPEPSKHGWYGAPLEMHVAPWDSCLVQLKDVT